MELTSTPGSPSVACITQPSEETGVCWQGLGCPCVGAVPGAITPGGYREAENADPG